MKRIVHWLAAVLGLCISVSAGAQILIGQTSGFTGPVAAGVKEVSDGARLYIDAANAKGYFADKINRARRPCTSFTARSQRR